MLMDIGQIQILSFRSSHSYIIPTLTWHTLHITTSTVLPLLPVHYILYWQLTLTCGVCWPLGPLYLGPVARCKASVATVRCGSPGCGSCKWRSWRDTSPVATASSVAHVGVQDSRIQTLDEWMQMAHQRQWKVKELRMSDRKQADWRLHKGNKWNPTTRT